MRVGLAIGSVLLLALGCAHTNEEVKDATAPQAGDAAVRARTVTSKTPPGQPPLAASPSGLMEPGSQQKISQALKGKGVVDQDVRGEQLGAALRKFQQSQGLAATGFPDHETLRRLGLDPKEIDESLENVSGTKPSDDAGKGGAGAESSGKKPARNQTPPSDQSGSQKASGSGNGGG